MIMRIRAVAKEGALAALAASKPGVSAMALFDEWGEDDRRPGGHGCPCCCRGRGDRCRGDRVCGVAARCSGRGRRWARRPLRRGGGSHRTRSWPGRRRSSRCRCATASPRSFTAGRRARRLRGRDAHVATAGAVGSAGAGARRRWCGGARRATVRPQRCNRRCAGHTRGSPYEPLTQRSQSDSKQGTDRDSQRSAAGARRRQAFLPSHAEVFAKYSPVHEIGPVHVCDSTASNEASSRYAFSHETAFITKPMSRFKRAISNLPSSRWSGFGNQQFYLPCLTK